MGLLLAVEAADSALAGMAGAGILLVDVDAPTDVLSAAIRTAIRGRGGNRPGLRGRQAGDDRAAILAMVADGYTDHQIARALGRAESTVRYHMRALFRDYQARSRTELVNVARRAGALPRQGARDQLRPWDAAAGG